MRQGIYAVAFMTGLFLAGFTGGTAIRAEVESAVVPPDTITEEELADALRTLADALERETDTVFTVDTVLQVDTVFEGDTVLQVDTVVQHDTTHLEPAAIRSPIVRVAPPDSTWLWYEERAGRTEGAFEIVFEADVVNGHQGLVSRDHVGYGSGGHLSVYLKADTLVYRLQSSSESRMLKVPGVTPDTAHMAVVAWGPDGMMLFLDEHLVGWNPGFTQATTPTERQVVVGALVTRSEATAYSTHDAMRGTGRVISLALWESYRDVHRALPDDSNSGPWVWSN